MSTTVPAVPMELELKRFFRAPRERVWRAWTEVEQLREWWGPKHFTNPRCEADVQTGGLMHIDMRAHGSGLLNLFIIFIGVRFAWQMMAVRTVSVEGPFDSVTT